MSEVKVKVVYCKCDKQVIVCAAMMPFAEQDQRWVRQFDYYWDRGHQLGLLTGPVEVGRCSDCEARRKPKSKAALADSASNPEKVHEKGEYATINQKARILLLASAQEITERERNKIVRHIHGIPRASADRVIARLNEIATKRRRSLANG